MKKSFQYLLLVLFLTGCATAQPVDPKVISKSVPSEMKAVDIKEESEPLVEQKAETLPETQELEEVEIPKGIIFAKTDFQGVLATSYVKLHVEGVGENPHQFELFIGEKGQAKAFAWEVQSVQPGYFFIELPAGEYKVKSISIPVGSTLATEVADIDFEIMADQATYLGTLNVNGTKEKIRLGGVPLIKPGFEYRAQVVDQQQEAMDLFKSRFSDYQGKVVVNLMDLNQTQNVPNE